MKTKQEVFMDYQALELLKSLHEKLEAQERIRIAEKEEQERFKAEQERIRAAEKAEQERIRAAEKAEQERIRAAEKAEQDENQRLLLDTFIEQEKRLTKKLDEQQLEFRKEISEIKEQLTRIENHVLVIRGKVVPVDLDGITPETKDELQEMCTEAFDKFVESPNTFDPRLETQYDPRPDAYKPLVSSYSLHKIKNQFLFRVGSQLDESNNSHSDKVVFGDFASKFSKALWEYNFDGYYPNITKPIFKKLEYYFFKERSNSSLVKNGRWT